MICQSCGHDNPVANRFCGGCGAPLVRTCPACGNSNPPDHRFCGTCGAALGESAPVAKQADTPRVRVSERVDPENLEGERKTVTALFADIKGSTELMEDLDPEEARAIIDPALKLMIDAVHRYDGYVVQSTGDGIFALFGAPVAHEDHPQRALYAALTDAGRTEALLGEAGARRRTADPGARSASTPAKWWCARSQTGGGTSSTRRSAIRPISRRGCRRWRRSARSR